MGRWRVKQRVCLLDEVKAIHIHWRAWRLLTNMASGEVRRNEMTGQVTTKGSWFSRIHRGWLWLGELVVILLATVIIWTAGVLLDAASKDDFNTLNNGISAIKVDVTAVNGKLDTGLAEVNGRLGGLEKTADRIEEEIKELRQYHMNGATKRKEGG